MRKAGSAAPGVKQARRIKPLRSMRPSVYATRWNQCGGGAGLRVARVAINKMRSRAIRLQASQTASHHGKARGKPINNSVAAAHRQAEMANPAEEMRRVVLGMWAVRVEIHVAAASLPIASSGA